MGVVYGTNPDPTTAGSKQPGVIDAEGNVTATLSGLTKGNTYYYATYVQLQGIVTKFGEVKSFVATDAQIATAGATDVTATKATLSATANGLDGIRIEGETQRNYGFKISTSEADVENGIDSLPVPRPSVNVWKVCFLELLTIIHHISSWAMVLSMVRPRALPLQRSQWNMLTWV